VGKRVEEAWAVENRGTTAHTMKAPHQGLDGLSPGEYERRLMCVVSG